MKIEYEGQSYDYDPDDLSVKQAAKIERHVWHGSVTAGVAVAQAQIAALAAQAPAVDLAGLRQAVDDLAAMCENAAGGTLLDWELGLMRTRSDCVQALAWLVLHGGRGIAIGDVEVKVLKLARAFGEAREAEEAAEKARAGGMPDPTGTPGPLPSQPLEETRTTPGNGRTRSRASSARA